MCQNFKPFVVALFLSLAPGIVSAEVYSAADLQVNKIFPSLSTKTYSTPAGGFLNNSTILDMAIENTVYPQGGGGAMKKVIPAALTLGRWLPWASAAFTAGYFIGDAIYKNWHESDGIYHDNMGYYEFIEDEVIVEDACPAGAVSGSSHLAQTAAAMSAPAYPCCGGSTVIYMGVYAGSTAALSSAKTAFKAANPGYSYDVGVTLGSVSNNACRYYYTSCAKQFTCNCGGVDGGQTTKKVAWYMMVAGFHVETVEQRNDLLDSTIWQKYENEMPEYPQFSKHVEEVSKKMEPDYNEYYKDGTVPELPNNPGLIETYKNMIVTNITNDDTVTISDDDYNNVINDVNDNQGIYQQVLAALNDSDLDKTNQDKTTPEEIAEGIGMSAVGEIKESVDDLKDFVKEEPSESDSQVTETDLDGIDGVTFEDDAWGWFTSKTGALTAAVQNKITVNLNGSCAHTLNCGSWGSYAADLCPYEGPLSTMGSVLLGIAGLMGIMAVMGRN